MKRYVFAGFLLLAACTRGDEQAVLVNTGKTDSLAVITTAPFFDSASSRWKVRISPNRVWRITPATAEKILSGKRHPTLLKDTAGRIFFLAEPDPPVECPECPECPETKTVEKIVYRTKKTEAPKKTAEVARGKSTTVNGVTIYEKPEEVKKEYKEYCDCYK